MEILLEIVFEIIFEGAFEVASSESRRIPLPLRVLCALLVVLVFGGVEFLIIFCGIVCLRDGEKLVAVLLFAFAALFLGVLVRQFVRVSRKR